MENLGQRLGAKPKAEYKTIEVLHQNVCDIRGAAVIVSLRKEAKVIDAKGALGIPDAFVHVDCDNPGLRVHVHMTWSVAKQLAAFVAAAQPVCGEKAEGIEAESQRLWGERHKKLAAHQQPSADSDSGDRRDGKRFRHTGKTERDREKKKHKLEQPAKQ